MQRLAITLPLCLLAAPAHAVIIRGHVTTPLGAPLPGSRIQLISLSGGPRNASSAISGIHGEYEIRTNLGGRFLLLVSPSVTAPAYAPQIGKPFYAGRSDLIAREIALDTTAVTPQLSDQATLLATPLAQLSSAVSQIQTDRLLTEATPLPALATLPGVLIVQTGQLAAPATIYLRGTPVTSVSIDGVTAEPLGGSYNLGTLSASGLAALDSVPAIELMPTPNPVRFLDAQGGTLSFDNAAARSVRPVITFAGDAGNLSTTRNEGILSATRLRADAIAAFARFNTDNDLPAAAAHLITSSANLGYHVSATTSLRATARQDVTAAPLALPFQLFALQPQGRQAAQNLIGQVSYETRTIGDWHNLLRYGLVRERAQVFQYTFPLSGLPVTVHGANGYSASGVATLPVNAPRQDFVTNRDEYTYLTDYPLRRKESNTLTGLLTLRYQDERAAAQQQTSTTLTRVRLARTHFSVAGALAGQVRSRLFVQATGFIDHSDLLGLLGSPRFGLTYVPVRTGLRRLRGTSLHLTAGTGLREPSLAEQYSTTQSVVARARTLALGIDQALIAQKLALRATYFHNQFSHESETISLNPFTLSDTLAYRTQGAESELRYAVSPRLILLANYTYLASLVQRSATAPSYNPSLPSIPIGALSALQGNRPFHRPPSTGAFAIQYTGIVFTASLSGNFASRSDDSTNLPQTPGLLLPNRNLSPGYTALNASATYAVSHSITAYAQLNNLLDDRHIAPIGFLSTPFQVRAGLRIRLGGE